MSSPLPSSAPVYTNYPHRLLSPDLARGFTLLGIAGANLTAAWAPVFDAPLGGMAGGVVDNDIWDKVAVMFGAIFFHVRGLPMFSTLLGFGVGLISLSLYRRGFPIQAARKTIAKRYAFLALFGVIHCVFLFWGDIMLAYGLLGILLGMLIGVKDKGLLIIAGVLFAMNVIFMGAVAALFFALGSSSSLGEEFSPNIGASVGLQSETYLDHIMSGLLVAVFAPLSLPVLIISLGPLMLVGFVAARRGVLSNVDQHRKLLWGCVGAAVAVMVFIGIPCGLSGIGVLPASTHMGWAMLNQTLGVITGPGIVAMIALAAEPLQRKVQAGEKLPEILVPVVALGKRSMSGYLLQSIVCVALVMPFSFGLGQGEGAAQTTLIAVGIWILSLVLAYILEKLNIPGPFEKLHRRLSYGKAGLPEKY